MFLFLVLAATSQQFDTCSHAIAYFKIYPGERPRHICLLLDGSFENKPAERCKKVKEKYVSDKKVQRGIVCFRKGVYVVRASIRFSVFFLKAVKNDSLPPKTYLLYSPSIFTRDVGLHCHMGHCNRRTRSDNVLICIACVHNSVAYRHTHRTCFNKSIKNKPQLGLCDGSNLCCNVSQNKHVPLP